MGFLIIPLGQVTPKTGTTVAMSSAIYSTEHPEDTYGGALIVRCEFFADDQSSGSAVVSRGATSLKGGPPRPASASSA